MNYDQILLASSFSFYCASVTSVHSTMTMTIAQAYWYITLNQEVMRTTREYREKLKQDLKEAKLFKKSKFETVTFSGVFRSKKDADLIQHSGLICFDFDHLGDRRKEIKQALIEDRNFVTALCFTSPSGDGLKWVICVDLDKASHREWYDGVRNYLQATYNVEVDRNCSNLSRGCFLPHDPLCYVHPLILQQPGICPF